MENGETVETVDKAVGNGSSNGIASNGNLQTKITSDRAIYEQFQSQVPCLIHQVSCEVVVASSNITDL